MKLRLFGTPRLERDGIDLGFRRRKSLALLAYLCVTRQPQSRDALTALLWPEFDDSRARNNLRRELSLLRAALGSTVLAADREQLTFVAKDELLPETDRFLDLIEGPPEHGRERLQALITAVELYTADFLEGFHIQDSPGFEEWRYFQALQFQDVLIAALTEIVELYSRFHEFEQAIPFCRRLLGIDQLNEQYHRRLMRVLAWSGRWTAAVRQFDECVRLLEDELGVGPESETTALRDVLLARNLPEPDQRLPESIDPQSAQRPIGIPSNLPSQRSRFIGRQRELDDLDRLLDDPEFRLISVMGPGGMGKTRLVLEAAARWVSTMNRQTSTDVRFPDGVYFVPLGQAASAERIVPEIAKALDLGFDGSGEAQRAPLEQLFDHLIAKRLLLILDNVEQVREGIAAVIVELLRAPGVRFLVTTRESLSLLGEHRYPIRGLEFLPSNNVNVAQSEFKPAAMLFEQSARRVQSSFQLSETNLPAVTEIARIVEGMPLAIELAGSWAQLLSPEDILAEVRRGIDLLATEAVDVPERQRSIRAIFDFTWQQMDAENRETLARLSVFQGGFTRASAEEIVGISLPGLLRLSNLSLIYYNRALDRYVLHRLMRQYAVERLATDSRLLNSAGRRHSVYFCCWLGEQAPDLLRRRQRRTVDRIRPEIENLAIAWQWAIANLRTDLLLTAINGFGHFFTLEGRFQEGCSLFAATAAALQHARPETSETSLVRANALAWQSVFDRLLGNVERSDATVNQVLNLLEHLRIDAGDIQWLQAFTLLQMAAGFFVSGDLTGKSYTESRRLFKECGDSWGEAMATAALGYVAFVAEEYERAYRLYYAGVSQLRQVGDRRSIVYLLGRLSALSRYQGRFDAAERYAREALVLARDSGAQGEIAEALGNLGGSLYFQGRFDEATEILRETARLLRDLGAAGHLAAIRLRLGMCAAALGDFERSRQHLAGSRNLYASVDQRHTAIFLESQLAIIDMAEGDVESALIVLASGVEELNAREMRVDRSWLLYLLGIAAWRVGDLHHAQRIALESLQLCLDVGGYIQLHWSIFLAALLLDDESEVANRAWQHVLHEPWIADNRAYQLISAGAIPAARAPDRGTVGLTDPYATASELIVLLQMQRRPDRNSPDSNH